MYRDNIAQLTLVFETILKKRIQSSNNQGLFKLTSFCEKTWPLVLQVVGFARERKCELLSSFCEIEIAFANMLLTFSGTENQEIEKFHSAVAFQSRKLELLKTPSLHVLNFLQ